MARDPDAELQFVGTERGIEARVVPELGYELKLIKVSGAQDRRPVGKNARTVALAGWALWQSRKLIKAFPSPMLWSGSAATHLGQSCWPLVFAASPPAILEQNSGAGNDQQDSRQDRPQNLPIVPPSPRRSFRRKKVVLSGNPIRAQIRAALSAESDAAANGAADATSEAERRPWFELFIFGGSQGAVAVNERD